MERVLLAAAVAAISAAMAGCGGQDPACNGQQPVANSIALHSETLGDAAFAGGLTCHDMGPGGGCNSVLQCSPTTSPDALTLLLCDTTNDVRLLQVTYPQPDGQHLWSTQLFAMYAVGSFAGSNGELTGEACMPANSSEGALSISADHVPVTVVTP
jgi:hypothetical protein